MEGALDKHETEDVLGIGGERRLIWILQEIPYRSCLNLLHRAKTDAFDCSSKGSCQAAWHVLPLQPLLSALAHPAHRHQCSRHRHAVHEALGVAVLVAVGNCIGGTVAGGGAEGSSEHTSDFLSPFASNRPWLQPR